jgi:hypothetical protein
MTKKLVVTMAGLLLLAAVPVLAHHSFAAEYDATKSVAVKGTVTKVEWLNPHMWIYFDVADNGNVAHWQCEGGAPNSLIRQGWGKNTLKPGDQISVEGFRAKDGTNTCNSRSVILSDGRKLFSGSADDGAPKGKTQQ